MAYPINSQIASRILNRDHTVRYKNDHLFMFKVWIVPVHLGEHWAMMVYLHLNGHDFGRKEFWYSDSLDCLSGMKLLGNMM